MPDSPCKHCVPPRRHVGCHDPDVCPDWAAYLMTKATEAAERSRTRADEEVDVGYRKERDRRFSRRGKGSIC